MLNFSYRSWPMGGMARMAGELSPPGPGEHF